MSHKSSQTTTAQQISVPLSTYSMNIEFYFGLFAPFMDETSRSAFAMICTSAYEYFERLYAESTAAILYSPPDKLHRYIVSIKELQLRNGCLRLKFFPISKSQKNNCPVKILCFGAFFQLTIPNESDCACVDSFMLTELDCVCVDAPMLNELDCACVDALIIPLDGYQPLYFPFEKFPNLKSCTFESVLNDHIVEDELCIFSMRCLEYISKHFCNTANGPLKIVENCATLQENPSLDCKLSDATPIKPSKWRKYIIGSYQVSEPLKMRGGELNLIPSHLRGLDKLEIKCHLGKDTWRFFNLLPNLRMLTYHYEYIYGRKDLESSSLNKGLDIFGLKSIMVLRIIDLNPNDKFMCMLTEGEGIVLVELIGRGYSKLTREIKLVPENQTMKRITLDQ